MVSATFIHRIIGWPKIALVLALGAALLLSQASPASRDIDRYERE